VGTRTDAALAQVVAARADFETEIERLEAAGRAAVDIPAKIRRQPVKAAGVAATAAFLVVGGPKRLFRRAKRAVRGEEEALPKSMLPDEIEKAVRKLGSDGKQVRGTLEREFAKYLEEREKERKKEGLVAAATALALGALRPVTVRAGKNLAERMMNPDGPSFEEQLEKVRNRRRAKSEDGGEGSAPESGGPESGAGL
jgi:hypothetical protein